MHPKTVAEAAPRSPGGGVVPLTSRAVGSSFATLLEPVGMAERVPVFPSGGSDSAVRARQFRLPEARLVQSYASWLRARGQECSRWRLRSPLSHETLVTDLFVDDDSELVEAKAETSRPSIRLAIGQLFDYRALIPVPVSSIAILLPGYPSLDIQHLLKSLDIRLIVELTGGGFRRDCSFGVETVEDPPTHHRCALNASCSSR